MSPATEDGPTSKPDSLAGMFRMPVLNAKVEAFQFQTAEPFHSKPQPPSPSRNDRESGNRIVLGEIEVIHVKVHLDRFTGFRCDGVTIQDVPIRSSPE